MPQVPRILVVDDDPNMQLLIEYNLRQRGYRAEIAADGPAALRRARQGDLDLVILDVMLPDESGFTICKQLRDIPQFSELPIILVTARARSEDLAEAVRVGATDYITKPFDPIRLVEQVEVHLQTARGPAS